MVVPASKVRTLCTASEAKLVRASREPELKKHSAAELKRLIVRTRELSEKWEGQVRVQIRARAPKHGAVEADANTQLKRQIFRDALDSFTAQYAKTENLPPAGGRAGSSSKAGRKPTHRATRSCPRDACRRPTCAEGRTARSQEEDNGGCSEGRRRSGGRLSRASRHSRED